MEELPLETKIDGETKTDDSTSSLSGIPEEYSEGTVIDENDPMIKLGFNDTVKVTLIDFTKVTKTGEEDLNNVKVVIVDENFERLTDVLTVIDGTLQLPEGLVISEPVNIVILESPDANLTVKIDLHGCVHPGKYNYVLFGQWSKENIHEMLLLKNEIFFHSITFYQNYLFNECVLDFFSINVH